MPWLRVHVLTLGGMPPESHNEIPRGEGRPDCEIFIKRKYFYKLKWISVINTVTKIFGFSGKTVLTFRWNQHFAKFSCLFLIVTFLKKHTWMMVRSSVEPWWFLKKIKRGHGAKMFGNGSINKSRIYRFSCQCLSSVYLNISCGMLSVTVHNTLLLCMLTSHSHTAVPRNVWLQAGCS